MFQFRRFPPYAYGFSVWYTDITPCGFPHSEICGSTRICHSPQLIAACHVLLRLPVPRHSPCALFCLTFTRSFRSAQAWVSATNYVSNIILELLSSLRFLTAKQNCVFTLLFHFCFPCCLNKSCLLFIQFSRCNPAPIARLCQAPLFCRRRFWWA